MARLLLPRHGAIGSIVRGRLYSFEGWGAPTALLTDRSLANGYRFRSHVCALHNYAYGYVCRYAMGSHVSGH
jgi:hypothetical protein